MTANISLMALRHLEEGEVDMSGGYVLSGPDGARLLDSIGRLGGLRASSG
jgi:hypothetical protein